MSYSTLREPVSNDHSAYVSAPVTVKFCNMGVVTSKKWVPGYLSLLEGHLRLYTDQESMHAGPQNAVYTLHLLKEHQTSEIKRKDYSTDPTKLAEFYCFYVEKDNGIFSASRQIKIGCHSRDLAEQICRAIKINTKGV